MTFCYKKLLGLKTPSNCTENIRQLYCFIREYAVHLMKMNQIMDTTVGKNGNSRIEFRVSNEDKALFDYAKQLSGFKTLSEFARYIITREAKALIKEEQQILASKRDKEIFFAALMSDDQQPNNALKSAIKHHEDWITE